MCALPIRKEFRELQAEDVIPPFLLYKQATGISPRTAKDYETTLKRFSKKYPDFMDHPRERTLEFLTASKSAVAFNLKYAYLKTFFDWLTLEGYYRGAVHPLAGIKKRRAASRIVELEDKDLRKLLDAVDGTHYAGLRDRAGILLSLDTGIRPGEMVQLLPGDYNNEKGEVIVRAEIAKTRTPRVLPLSPVTVQAIDKLLLLRPSLWRSAPIFASERGKMLQVTTWSRRIKTYGQKVGLDITAYCLRHAAAITLLRHGADAFTVQRILGHTTMQMTRVYVNLTNTDIRDAHAAAGVLASLTGSETAPMKRCRAL